MTCQRYQRQLSALLDGELTGSDKDRVEEHLLSCEECALMWRRLNMATERVKSLRFHIDEKRLAAKVKERIASGTPARPIERPLAAWRRVPAFALLVFIAIGMGNMAGRSLVEVLFPATDDASVEVQLLENGSSFGDVFIDLTGAASGERYDR